MVSSGVVAVSSSASVATLAGWGVGRVLKAVGLVCFLGLLAREPLACAPSVFGVAHERFLNCSTQSSAENAAPAKAVGRCWDVDVDREESWLDGSIDGPDHVDPFRAVARPRLFTPLVARGVSVSDGFGAKKPDHPAWEVSCQSSGENSFLRFPWLLLLLV